MGPAPRLSLGLTALALVLVCARSEGQIALSSLTEVQRGRVPGADSTALSTLYEQMNVDYAAGEVQAGIRAELFRAHGTDRRVTYLSQAHLRWTHGPIYAVAGNYDAILGRGLTLRAFELPGVVLESQAYRRRYAPSQDLEGGMASWTGDVAGVKALIGRPVKSDIPPGVPDVERREDWVAGGEATFRPVGPLSLGATAVNLRPSGRRSSWAWSGLAEVDLFPAFRALGLEGSSGNLYGEFARRAGGPEAGHGLYLTGNYAVRRLGISIEYKDYDNFALGVNDPPSLVREHTAALLNRSTHVLMLHNERGYQVEAVYALPDLAAFTANASRGRSDLTGLSTVFDERYLSADLDRFDPALSASAFYGWGRDELEGISDRRTAGLLLESDVAEGQTLAADVQAQRASRPFADFPTFTDTYASISYRHPLGIGAALMMERSSDLLETDDPATLSRIETAARTWWAVALSGQFAGRYEAQLFAGRRRGGTACTSGTCYQVLPFSGLEIRITSRF